MRFSQHSFMSPILKRLYLPRLGNRHPRLILARWCYFRRILEQWGEHSREGCSLARKPKAEPIVYPVCVRHSKSRKDVRLRHYFLCDSCAKEWSMNAFSGNRSLYNGEKVKGYCLLCNRIRTVRIRTWFLCDICHRVAGAIGRNHVASRQSRVFG